MTTTNLVVLFFFFAIYFLKLPILSFTLLFFAIVFIFFTIIKIKKLKTAGILILLNYVFWLFSGFISGGINFNFFSIQEFFRGEGRIFLYYLPLLYFAIVKTGDSSINFLKKFLYAMSIISFILSLLWLFNIFKTPLSIGKDFSGLITSHTAAGTFFATIFLFLIIQGLKKKNKTDIIFALIMALPLFLTASRQAILAIAIVMIFFLIIEKKFKTLIKLITLFTLVFIIGINLNIRSVERFKSLASPEFISLIPYVMENANDSEIDKKLAKGVSDNEAIVNSLNRFILWRKAQIDFFKSPLVGIGFGRYNDVGLQFCGLEYILFFACKARENVTNVTSAHNSFLHFLSEVGIVGLFLNMLLWYHLYSSLNKFQIEFEQYDYIFLTAKCIIIFILINAMFGHALAAPAIGFSSLTIVGMAYSFGFTLRRRLGTKLYLYRA